MPKNFADRLITAVKSKGNPICVGLDPNFDKIPEFIKEKVYAEKEKSATGLMADALVEFNKGIIDAVCDIVPVVKPQVSFYEILGHEGMRAYEETLRYAELKGLLTIADVKRNDIGSTAEMYAKAYLGEITMFKDENEVITPVFNADSITVNPYLGWDGVKPFVDEARKYEKGLFVLCKTSNKCSGDLQDLQMSDGNTIYEIMGYLIDSWGANEIGESGYSFVGAVVGATYPEQAKKLRKIMPNAIFLVPGYGAQGGTAEDIKVCFKDDGLGAIVNSSRGIIFAYEKMPEFGEKKYAEAARKACLDMKKDLERVL